MPEIPRHPRRIAISKILHSRSRGSQSFRDDEFLSTSPPQLAEPVGPFYTHIPNCSVVTWGGGGFRRRAALRAGTFNSCEWISLLAARLVALCHATLLATRRALTLRMLPPCGVSDHAFCRFSRSRSRRASACLTFEAILSLILAHFSRAPSPTAL